MRKEAVRWSTERRDCAVLVGPLPSVSVVHPVLSMSTHAASPANQRETGRDIVIELLFSLIMNLYDSRFDIHNAEAGRSKS